MKNSVGRFVRSTCRGQFDAEVEVCLGYGGGLNVRDELLYGLSHVGELKILKAQLEAGYSDALAELQKESVCVVVVSMIDHSGDSVPACYREAIKMAVKSLIAENNL